MKNAALALAACLSLAGVVAHADTATEQEVTQTILDANAYTRTNLRGMPNEYAKDGAMEFWSSGGLMQRVSNEDPPGEFLSFNVDVKHINVLTIIPGQVAVAHYYSDGSMHPKGSDAVGNYRTRVSQVFVKEDGKWKIRSSHWSAIAGGSGTSQTALP